jgi:uncharacterized membrane protein
MEPLPRFFPLERMVAFSDGVFAVVITILVLGIEVPSEGALDPTAMALAHEKFLHQLLAYVVAFGLIAMYWTQHSLLFAGLRRVDRGLVVLISLLNVKAGMVVILVMPLVFFANFMRVGKHLPSDGAYADDADPEAPS